MACRRRASGVSMLLKSANQDAIFRLRASWLRASALSLRSRCRVVEHVAAGLRRRDGFAEALINCGQLQIGLDVVMQVLRMNSQDRARRLKGFDATLGTADSRTPRATRRCVWPPPKQGQRRAAGFTVPSRLFDRFLELPRNEDELRQPGRTERGQQQEHRAIRLALGTAQDLDRFPDRLGEPIDRLPFAGSSRSFVGDIAVGLQIEGDILAAGREANQDRAFRPQPMADAEFVKTLALWMEMSAITRS